MELAFCLLGNMGALCCCFQVDLFESYANPNTSMSRNCPCLNCFLQSFMGLYASIFNRVGMHPIPSTVEASSVMNSTTSFDDSSLSDVYHSPPRPLPYDADPRYFRFAKGSSHSGGETEPLRGDTEMSSEILGGGAKRNKSGYEDGSKEAYSKGSPTNEKSKLELSYADSDDEDDICPTCLDDYTPENPKIITKCSHHFHLSCIYEWMERSETCPVCNKETVFDSPLD